VRERVREAIREALAADEAWSAELQRLFGMRAGDVRYTVQGKGEPGTGLRRLHDEWVKANDEWVKAKG
jgi:hypothetical protein